MYKTISLEKRHRTKDDRAISMILVEIMNERNNSQYSILRTSFLMWNGQQEDSQLLRPQGETYCIVQDHSLNFVWLPQEKLRASPSFTCEMIGPRSPIARDIIAGLGKLVRGRL
jgi:hypothetical protein